MDAADRLAKHITDNQPNAYPTNTGGRVTPEQRVGQRVRRLRRSYGWSAAELSDRLLQAAGDDASHLSRRVISMIERHGEAADDEGSRTRPVRLDEVFMFALALGTSPMALIFPDDDEPTYVGHWEFDVEEFLSWWMHVSYPIPEHNVDAFVDSMPSRVRRAIESMGEREQAVLALTWALVGAARDHVPDPTARPPGPTDLAGAILKAHRTALEHDEQASLARRQRGRLIAAYRQAGGNVTELADLLDVHRKNIYAMTE